jgi:hypothetical protein
LEFDGNVEETFMQNFQISYEAYGMVQTHDLKEGGADIPLTNDNRQGTSHIPAPTFLHIPDHIPAGVYPQRVYSLQVVLYGVNDENLFTTTQTPKLNN